MTTAVAAPRRTWDLVLTIILLVVYFFATLGASLLGLLLGFASSACGQYGTCDSSLQSTGFWLAVLGPWIAFVVIVVITVILLVRRTLAFWLPLVGIGVALGLFIAGSQIVALATQGTIQ